MLFSFSSSSKKRKGVFISWMLWSEKGQNFPPGARWLEREGRGKYLLNLSMSSYSIFLINIYLDIMWGKPSQTTAMQEIPLLFSSCQLLVRRGERRKNRDKERCQGVHKQFRESHGLSSWLSRRQDALRKSMHLWTMWWVKEVEQLSLPCWYSRRRCSSERENYLIIELFFFFF